MTLTIPTLETERLILRGPVADDFEPLAERLGCVLDRVYENEQMGTTRMYRHPAPEALS